MCKTINWFAYQHQRKSQREKKTCAQSKSTHEYNDPNGTQYHFAMTADGGAVTTNGHEMDEWQSGADGRRLIELTGELICFFFVVVAVVCGDWIEKLKWFFRCLPWMDWLSWIALLWACNFHKILSCTFHSTFLDSNRIKWMSFLLSNEDGKESTNDTESIGKCNDGYLNYTVDGSIFD